MEWWHEINSTWTLFLDRDGVINERKWNGYIENIQEFQFLPGVIEGIKTMTGKFGNIFVVTNQQGIAKNIMTECELLEIHQYMCARIKENGGEITRCYFAPELKHDQNSSRKPKPAMALQAKSDFPEIEFTKSVMIGDTDSDILFGKNLGMKTVRIKTKEEINIEADLTLQSLQEFSILCGN